MGGEAVPVVDISARGFEAFRVLRATSGGGVIRQGFATRLGMMLIAVTSCGLPASAGEPKWPTANYDYVVVDEDLRSVLQRFGANTGIRIALSDKVQGHVRGRMQSGSAHQFLDELAQQFGLDWYYDGMTLWISAASEATTKMLALRGVRLDDLKAALSSMKLSDQRFALREGPTPDIVLAAGPPRYLSMVEQVLDALSAGLPQPPSPTPGSSQSVVIFRGSTVNQVVFPHAGSRPAS